VEVIELTEKARYQAKALLNKETETKEGLRLAIIGGGCAGLQYKLGWSDSKEDDFVHEYDNGLKVIVDPKSAVLLSGSTLEYYDNLEKAGFEVVNPNSESSCGCGKSFS